MAGMRVVLVIPSSPSRSWVLLKRGPERQNGLSSPWYLPQSHLMPRRLVCPCCLAWGISTGKARSHSFSIQSIGVSSPSILILVNQSRANLGGFWAIPVFLTSEFNLVPVHLGWPCRGAACPVPFPSNRRSPLYSFPGCSRDNQVLEKLEENQVPMPDWVLKSSGAVTLYKPISSKVLPVQLDKRGI